MAERLGLLLAFLILLGNLSVVHCKEANVTCTVHEDCILPCSFRPSGTVVIHWYKQQTPVHSYYYNKDQFGLQNKHFSGRTCLFNAHILQGNASLLLRRVKVQDKGRYKCYTSTKKGNQEMFVNLALKAVIQSVTMEMGEGLVSCSSYNIYPAPSLTWTTDPASTLGSLPNITTTTADHRGLFSVHSSLLIGSNLSSDHAYFCSVASADRSQVWTASWKNQEDLTAVEGHQLSIPCVAPHHLLNFSLTWSFSSASASSSAPEPGVVLLRYDSRSRGSSSMWEGRAELDPDRVVEGDGSLWLRSPDSLDHSGMYVCTFSALHSKHTVQTRLNVSTAPQSVHQDIVERSRWCTVSSVAFVFTIIILLALPQCLRQKVPAAARGGCPTSRAYGASPPGCGGADELLNVTAVHISGPHCSSSSIQISIQHLQASANQEEAEPDKPGTNNLKPTNGLLPHYVVEEEESFLSTKPVTPARLQENTAGIQDEDSGITEKMVSNN